MPTWWEIALGLLLASIIAAWVAFGTLGVLGVTGRIRRLVADSNGRRIAPGEALEVPAFTRLVIGNDPGAIGLIWISLLQLAPLLVLASWALIVQLRERAAGAGLVLVLIHLFLLWRLVLLGTQVQRRIEISRTSLTAHPVFGRSREVLWTTIARVEEVSYAGPGVSGLYLYEDDGSLIVLDVWLLRLEGLSFLVRTLASHASWTRRRRGFIFG